MLAIKIAIAEANPGQALPVGPPRYSPASSDLATPDPETGTVGGGSYDNKYFDLSYPLLPDWREDFKGPEPSNGGYYVLSAVRPKGELNGSVLVTAQDRFFVSRPMRNSLDLLKQRQQQALQSTLTIDGPPREIKISNRSFARLDYSGAGLHHTIFAIDIRCHVITFEVTSRHPEVLESLTQQMNRVTLPPAAEEEGGGEFPVCINDYASGNNLIHKVEPVDIGPRFTRVPARIIIDRQGRVKHVHVINAFPDQARSVQDALMQWTFKPYIQNGQPVEVETGILFEFGAHDRTHAGTMIIAPGAREGQSTTRKMP